MVAACEEVPWIQEVETGQAAWTHKDERLMPFQGPMLQETASHNRRNLIHN